MDSDGTILLYTRDHLGSIRELVDMNQVVRARYEYDPYGNVTKVSGDRDSDFLYTGHYWHQQSGLFLTLFRAYDPELGRWLSRDPKGEGTGTNLYAYVTGDPINLMDPFGLDSWQSHWDWNEFWNVDVRNAAAGAGDGVMEVLTLSLWDGDAVRNWLGIDPVDSCSSSYQQAKSASSILTEAVLIVATWGQGAALRMNYVNSIKQIPKVAMEMIEHGVNPKVAAEWAYNQRNIVKEVIRRESGAIGKALAEGRNMFKYGNKVAPTFLQLYERKGALGVIQSAGRSSVWWNRFFGIW